MVPLGVARVNAAGRGRIDCGRRALQLRGLTPSGSFNAQSRRALTPGVYALRLSAGGGQRA